MPLSGASAGLYDALTIARWFAAWAEEDEAELSNLKLQKLLYYAQGHYLGLNNRPLFNDPIEAWSHGPVVPAVYHAFKHFGTNDVALGEFDQFDWDQVDENTTQFLIEIWETYGSLAAWRLRNMTHAEPPWAKSFEDDKHHIEISQGSMRRYFSSRSHA